MTKRILRDNTAILVLIVAMIIGPACVQAQSYDASAVSAMEGRFQHLEEEIRRLTGVVEEQSHEIRVLKDNLERLEGDVNVRFDDLSRGQSGAAAGVTEDASSASAATEVEIGTETGATAGQSDQQSNQLGTLDQAPDGSLSAPSSDEASNAYEAAFSYIKNRQYDEAEKAFNGFIKNYPNDKLTANALYWYGETFYVRGNYDKAVRVFAEGYKKYPQGQKAPDNLLKLAMSLASLEKKDDACVAYKQIGVEYAGIAAPILKRAQTEMSRIGCQ